MQVKVITLSEKGFEDNEWQGWIKIVVDGERALSFSDGEPEDNNLGRNFNDVYNIAAMMRKAHASGRAGEEFSLENEKVDEIE